MPNTFKNRKQTVNETISNTLEAYTTRQKNEAVGELAIFDSQVRSELQFKILYMDTGIQDRLELRLAQQNFEFLPRSLLSYVSKWCEHRN